MQKRLFISKYFDSLTAYLYNITVLTTTHLYITICRGFSEAYMTAREFVHTTIRQELSKELGDVLVTGHSLGGALGGLCALDLQIHTLASINIELEKIHDQSKSKHIHDGNLPRKLHRSMYSYGSPKIGNKVFIQMYDKLVPDSFRCVGVHV